jgi:hypothetical protein
MEAVMKRIILVLLFVWQISLVYGQPVVVNTDEVTSSYLRYYSSIGFSKCEMIINNGYLPLLEGRDSLCDMDLAVLDKAKLRLLRNTIYAKHGLIFSSEDLRMHFSQFAWYKPTFKSVDDKLTSTDRENINSILVYENAIPNYNVRKEDLAGLWLGSFPAPSGDAYNITIDLDGNIEMGYNTMAPSAAISCKGTYKLENGFLVVYITRQIIVLGDYFVEGWLSYGASSQYGNMKSGTLLYDNPVRMVLPIGELKKTLGEYEVENRKIGVRIRVKGN